MSQSDCPVCRATAVGGRIRVTEERAQLFEALLHNARRDAVRDRRSAINSDDEARHIEADRTLRMIDGSLEEILRTQIEKGWHDANGQLQRPNT